MSSARSDLFIYIGVALATTLGLFVLHKWYATFVDVRYHQQLEEGRPAEALLAAREEDEKLLESGKVPLAQAMSTVAKGRPASVAPAPSEDVSAVSGWIHARGFKPATAHPVRAPQGAPQTQTAPTTPTPTTLPATDPAHAPATPTPAAPTAAPQQQLRLKTQVMQQPVVR